MEWGNLIGDAVKMIASGLIGVGGGLLLGRKNHSRQRSDQQADKQREEDKRRLTPLIEAIEQLEPKLRRVKEITDEALHWGIRGPFLSTGDPVALSLDRDHEQVVAALEKAAAWAHDHVPELIELGLPRNLRAVLRTRLAKLILAHHLKQDFDYRDIMLGLFRIVAPLREQLRARFRYV